MKDTETDLFVLNCRARFERSIDVLDAATLSGITQARYRALAQVREPAPRHFHWLPAGIAATACVAVLVYSLLPQTKVEEKTFIDEIEIISELDLYEDLEFYEWLEQHEIPS